MLGLRLRDLAGDSGPLTPREPFASAVSTREPLCGLGTLRFVSKHRSGELHGSDLYGDLFVREILSKLPVGSLGRLREAHRPVE